MLGGGVGGGVGGGNCREIWHPLLSGSLQLFGPARSDDLWWPAQGSTARDQTGEKFQIRLLLFGFFERKLCSLIKGCGSTGF